jgi:hypothetical protein
VLRETSRSRAWAKYLKNQIGKAGQPGLGEPDDGLVDSHRRVALLSGHPDHGVADLAGQLIVEFTQVVVRAENP